ncbi:endolytic transglycosylase MltG [Lentibacillus sp. N15]|uniref:endolytic transglycosylase MltG n=1 Tax=Lentibacillus songyuanensis TaxID=3136161 RepID=UPI0031BB068C
MFKKTNRDTDKDKLTVVSEEARTVRKIVATIIIAIVLILLVGGISGYMYVKSALKPVNPESKKEVNVNIPMGSSTSDIASILEDKGIVKDSRVFRFYIKFKNEADFQAGDYTFSPSMTLNKIIESLKNGEIKEANYTITIPEGKNMEQIAQIYAKKLPISKKEFLDQVNDPKYVKKLIKQYPDVLSDEILDNDIKAPLEGYLFAATYKFYDEDPSADAIVQKMLKKTVKVVTPYLDEISEQDLTIHKAFTMASLIENEASSEDQRKKIAGVFYNRLEAGIPLQTDPTVLYALGKHKDKVLLKDLKVKSPYNTYYVDTLPIGPISNFAESSLTATLHPEDTDYKYFLHDGKGHIHYAKTHEEHVKMKEKYIQ